VRQSHRPHRWRREIRSTLRRLYCFRVAFHVPAASTCRALRRGAGEVHKLSSCRRGSAERATVTHSITAPSGHCSGGALKTLCELQHVASAVMLQLCFSCASSVHLQGVMTQGHCGTQVTSYHQGSAARATESFTHHWSPVHSHSCARRCVSCSTLRLLLGFSFASRVPAASTCRVLCRRATVVHRGPAATRVALHVRQSHSHITGLRCIATVGHLKAMRDSQHVAPVVLLLGCFSWASSSHFAGCWDAELVRRTS